MKTIMYSKAKLEARILKQYSELDIHDYIEDGKTEHELVFTDTPLKRAGEYKIALVYDPFYRKVYDVKNIVAYEPTPSGDVEVKLKLHPDNYNPNKPSLYHELEKITKKELKNEEQRTKDYRDIQETNNWLNKNYR